MSVRRGIRIGLFLFIGVGIYYIFVVGDIDK